MSSILKGPGLEWVRRNLPRVPLLVNLTWGLFRDPRVPVPLKAALLGVLAYVASPIDLIPDFIPLIGMVDDLLLLLAAIEMFVRLAPAQVVEDLEARYREGHGPLRTDLEKAEKYMGRFWSWATRKVIDLSRKYARKVKDQAFVNDVELKSTKKH